MYFPFNTCSAMPSTQQKKWTLFIGLFLFVMSTLLAQVTVQQFPRDHQLYQRNLSTNKATIPIEGIIHQVEQYTSVTIRVYRASTIFIQQSVNLAFNSGQANFSMAINIPAELSNFSIELYGVRAGQQILLKKAEKIVAGDVILINGQSNAEALAAGKTADYDEFARSYTSNFGWNYIQYSFPGQWGARVAKNIIRQQGIPVAVFNQAEGGKDIAYFLKPTGNPIQSNYGKLSQRLSDAGVQKVTSILWFQGEGDGWTTTIERYKDLFQQLQQAWQQDYQPAFTYLFQIRYQSCGHTKPYPFEAQRQLAEELPKVGIISTTNLDHDGCHFPYENGYREMADNLFLLMRRDIYGLNSVDIAAPNISKIIQVADSELLLEFNNTSSLSVVGNPWGDFRLEDSNVRVINGLVEGNQIRLFLSDAVANIKGVSYVAHTGSALDWLFNPKDIGILQFYNYPVTLDQNLAQNESVSIPLSEESSEIIEEVASNISIDCNAISVVAATNRLTINGLTAPNVMVQVFDKNWSFVYKCIGPNCSINTKVLDNLEAGSYFVKIQLLSEDWQLECFLEEAYMVAGTIISADADCASTQISTGRNTILVSGLKAAPVSSILVLSMNRNQKYFNCWGAGCGDADEMTIPIGTGTYRVIVKNYTAAFEEYCEKEQIIVVNSNLQETPVFNKQGYIPTNTLELSRMVIYPTIAKENIYINIFDPENQVTQVQIWSQYGQRIQSLNVANHQLQIELDIQHLSKGVYFLNAPLQDGTNLTRKVIVK